jgi:uncharacterized protein YjiS (DUF1127 family)
MATLAHLMLTEYQPSPHDALSRMIDTIRVWRRRARERQRLAELSEYELHDIGCSPVDRINELAKPFWRG